MIQVLLWLPLAAGLACLLIPRRYVGWWALSASIVTLGVAIYLVADFVPGVASVQHVVDESWIPGLGVRYQLGDAYSGESKKLLVALSVPGYPDPGPAVIADAELRFSDLQKETHLPLHEEHSTFEILFVAYKPHPALQFS